MPNPFKRRPSAASGSSQKGAGSTGKSAKAGSTSNGIRIAANSQANSSSEGQQNNQLSGQRLDPSNLLPPESNYRTSLIMPHLTKRFTLLRAPDGTMVTPEAMRAHLRAQRARARATGVPGTQCFLTEEEEDEIIDQLRRQTRMEEMEEWEASVQQQQQQQQQQQRQQQIDQMQFGGTDGFGTWSTPYQGHQRSDSKIDEGITESFNNLRDSTTNSSRSDDQHGATGRLFSSSSSNRDFAYIKEVQKSRAAKRGVDENSYDQKDENEQKFTPILQGIHDEGSDAEKTSRGESVTPIGAHPIEIGTESYTPEEDAMPGDFLVASHRESRRLSASNSNNDVDNSLLTPNAAARPPHHRHSELLTTLTPEAFNRVSMALEEVYEMVSGRVEESEEDEEDDLNPDRSGATLLAYDSESGPSYEDDELSDERESLEDTHQLNRRPSLESETNSFTSARSEVAASAFDGHGRAEALSGIGNAAAAFSSISPDDRAMSPSAPAGWSVSQPTSLSNRSTFGGSRLGQNTRHVAGKSSMGSSSAASVASQQSNRQDSPSLRRPLHTPPFDSLPSSAKSHNGSYPSPLNSMLPPTNGTENTMISPLAAGFHLAGNSVGQTEAETKAASAAAAAAATAAGVAASNYVAQAQQQQKEASSNRASGQMITSDSSATIVPTSEITVAYPQSEPSNREVLADDQYDEQQPNQQLSQIAIPSDLASVNTTYSPSRPSAAENQVLSANAIAARSPKYFPTATNRSMHSYATGFRNAAPATPDGVQSSANRSEEIDRLQSTPGPVNQTSASSLEVSNHDNSSKLQTDNHESLLISSATVSPVGANSQPHTMQSQSAKSQKFPEKLERVDAIQTGALQPSATQSSLSPLPPSDPEEASKWRKLYGIEKSADATSIRSGISMQISEDEPLKGERSEEQDDIEDDVWARVARTTSPNVDLQPNNTTDSKIAVNPTRSPDTQTYSASANSAGIGSSHDAFTEKSGLSMDELHKIQNDLVRSANAKQNAEVSAQESAARLEKAREKARKISADRSMNFNGTHSGSRNTSLDTIRRGSESITRSSESKVRPVEALGKNVDEERAKSIPKEEAEKRSIDPIDPTEKNSPSQTGQGSSQPLKAPESRNSNKLQRETSSRSFRSQVMYDVTSSHRPTSPPPRTHKTSLSNLPTLQDLSLGVSPVRTTAGVADRNSTSLISMMETSARVHDQLSASDTQPGKSGISGAIAEEEGASEDFEDVAVEDGFGGFTWERRKRLPRSQSHDVLSSSRLHESDDAQDEGNQPSQFSPKSFRSEPGAEREGEANDAGDASWSRLPGEEPFVNPNLIDDVAAQARAATHALKGQNGQRPKMRSKSLGKVRKNLSKTISQPQLVSTTQRMEHTQGLPNVDDSLRKKDTNKRPPFPQEMRSSSLTPASSPVVKNTSPTLQQQVQRKQSPRQPPTQKGLATPADATKEGSREVQAQSPRSPSTMKRLRSGSANTLQSRSVSPTDYKTNAPTDYKAQTVSARKNSSASGHIRRSSSFGHRGQLDGSISPSTQISPTRSASINAHSTNSPTSPQGERGQTGLSRLLTRFRGRKASELPAVIEPYPSSGQSPSAARSSPALSNVTTPNTATSPVFRTPKESPSQGQFSSNKGDAFAGRLAMPNQTGYSSLADMFSPTADGQSPSRTSNQNGKVLASQESPITGSRSPTDHTSALAPAAPIHARLARGASTIDGVQKPPLPNVELANVSKRRSGRETIIRRTIIVSTYDPGADDRRKSVSAARKGSLRKSTLPQSPQQNSTNSTTLQHHRRTSSTTSSKARRSIQDRPPTPPGPDGVSGTHRRKLSQEVKAKPLPPTAKNVYEAPTQNPINANSGTLGVPQSSSRSNVRSSVRASNVSGYGASLYDLYDRDDDDDTSLNTGNAQNRSSGLAPPNDSSHRSSSMIRQTSDGTNTGARHIEVTERADGSVVWQVIAGLADRSSVYTASIGYGGGHSRQNSDTSQYSFMRSPPQNGAFSMTSPMGKPNALADEDGRSLFARTPTKKNFSIDEDEFVPPLPNMNELYQSNDTATATASQQAQQLDFEMATTTAGQAATRIVYTSDAELAALLESLAGPDKSSAKFAFQRVYEGESDGGKEAGENGTESQDTAFASLPSNSSRQNVRSSAQDGSVNSVSAATSSRQSQKNGRPVSIWTESELTSDPTGALRSQRFKIEAEIYSLLQRETAMAASSPPNDFQTSPGEYVKSKIVQ